MIFSLNIGDIDCCMYKYITTNSSKRTPSKLEIHASIFNTTILKLPLLFYNLNNYQHFIIRENLRTFRLELQRFCGFI